MQELGNPPKEIMNELTPGIDLDNLTNDLQPSDQDIPDECKQM